MTDKRELEAAGYETHFEWPLDLDDEPPAAHRPPVYVDVVSRDEERRPIVPASLHRGNLGATVRRASGRTTHRAAYHGTRLPAYLLKMCWWSVVGLFRLVRNVVGWWWVTEQHGLRQQAATSNDPKTWIELHKQAKASRSWRGSVLTASLLGLVLAAGLLWWLAPRWTLLALAVAVLPWLAHYGRPIDRPIVSPAMVIPRYRVLTADIVLRAYYAAKLGDPDKAPIGFGSTMARDGEGSRVLVDMPYGKHFGDAVRARSAIASGLDVAESQIYLTRDPSSTRRHQLWVADRDPLAIPAGRTPLLACKPTDIWAPAPFGVDERGRLVTVPLMWNSILVGAVPRTGKTFSARTLALYAALDPYAKLTIFDGKGSPDWRRFALVADRYGFGLAYTRDGDPVEIFLETLRELKADVQDRYERLSALPAEVCPNGTLTRDLARDPRYRMPVRLVVIDECQEYFTLDEASKEIGALLVYLVKIAPAAGVIVLSATQRPSGVGRGEAEKAFISFRDNHQIRFGLRTPSWQVSELVLGQGAYGEGFDSSTLLPEYKGVGILRGAADDTPTVRTYLADGQDAERILLAARALRQRAGTLSGMAAGESFDTARRDVLADVHSVFYAGEAWVSWQQIAARLAEHLPEGWSDTNPEAVSAQVRALGVPSVNGRQDNQVLKGAKLAEIKAAIQARQIDQ